MFVALTGSGSNRDAIFVRITLIHNPGAGDDDQPNGEALQSLLRGAGHSVRYQPADADNWAAVLDEPADLVAVAGGDGTVGRVAKKLIGRDIPVAPLPLGTANNISKTLGLDGLTLEEIVAGWHGGRRLKFDVGIANGPWGTRYFVEGFGVGLLARTLPAAEDSKTLASLDSAEAKVAYAIQMLRERLEHCAPHRLEMMLDGRDYSGEYVLFEALNMEFIGPNLYLAPDIDSGDGRLDVVLVTTAERDKLHESLEHWQDGKLEPPRLTRHLAAGIELEWSGFEVHIDDEAWPDKDDGPQPALAKIELKVEREALIFFVPAATP